MAPRVVLTWTGKLSRQSSTNDHPTGNYQPGRHTHNRSTQTEQVLFMALAIYMGVAKTNNKKLIVIA